MVDGGDAAGLAHRSPFAPVREPLSWRLHRMLAEWIAVESGPGRRLPLLPVAFVLFATAASALTWAAAAVLYRLIERPALRLKRYFPGAGMLRTR